LSEKLNSRFLNSLVKLNRLSKRSIMIFVDSFLVIIILLTSFSLRLGYWFWPKNEILWLIIISPLIAIPVFISFRLYWSVIRFTGIQALSTIAQAVTLYSLAWGLMGYMATIDGIPRSVIVINWMFALIGIGGSRILIRWFFSEEKLFSVSKKNRVIIYGAGSAGRQLSHALQLSSQYKHVAYIDDDLSLDRTYINGIPVFDNKDIKNIFEKYRASEVLLALPSVSLKIRNKIINKLTTLGIQVRSLPSLSKLAEGKVKIEDLLEIDIGDLLGRERVSANPKLLKIKNTNKVVLVTGAGGSIGSELCRQILLLKPKSLILFERNEASLYLIEKELSSINSNQIDIYPVIGSIKDFQRMRDVFKLYNVQTIYHAAAYKHVPLVEFNQSQGVLNNTIGTMLAAEAAIAEKIETFVLISTDKAVRPTSTMGATKRVAELILQALSKHTNETCLTMVRFGNVLDSSGSVIPLFKNQIKKGGPITVTDKNMVRYFMTIPEAVELVIQAGALSKGGDVFVLDMGKPVRIYDLAVKMIQLSGLQVLDKNNPEGDIEITYTGLRPGEKLYEELLISKTSEKTENKLIMREKEKIIEWSLLKPLVNDLQNSSIIDDKNKIRDILLKIVPEFQPKD
jgi:FlaA1/EpsC-like NDP-sugar epimerase